MIADEKDALAQLGAYKDPSALSELELDLGGSPDAFHIAWSKIRKREGRLEALFLHDRNTGIRVAIVSGDGFAIP